MKVFGCKNQNSYGGGLILVAAETKEKAYFTAANDNNLSYLFDWHDDTGWCEPDGNINHCTSYTYPINKWREIEHLSTDLTEPKIIIEDHYTE